MRASSEVTPVAADIGCVVVCAAGCDLEHDCDVLGGDLIVAVEVAFLWRGGPWIHDCVSKGVASGKRSTLTPSGNAPASPIGIKCHRCHIDLYLTSWIPDLCELNAFKIRIIRRDMLNPQSFHGCYVI